MVSGFDNRLFTMIGSHPSIIVGTCDRALVPTMARGFGARVVGETIEVLVSRWPGPQTLDNILETGRVAVTFAAPETFESYQVKGRGLGWGEATAEDLALCATYTEVIRNRIVRLGEPEIVVRSTFSARGLFRLTLAPEGVFEQTPGRNAGQRL